jgi:hypothetical protein
MKMLNIDTIFLFIFIFSILTILSSVVKIISTVSQKNPQPVFKSDTTLLTQGLAITYIITYIIQNLT